MANNKQSSQRKKKNQKVQKQKKIIVISVLAVVLVAIVAFATWMITKDNENKSVPDTSLSNQDLSVQPQASAPVDLSFLDGIDTSGSKNVEFVMTDGNRFVMTVLPKVAPITAENFLGLVEKGFYDGIIFHRVIPGFMAQGGDPEGTGMGGSDTPIKGEFASNGFDNPLLHKRGVVSMARTNDPDSASSQFFICYDSTPHLDGEYAAFGYISEGMEVVDTFYSEGTDANDRPLKEVKIKTAKIIE